MKMIRKMLGQYVYLLVIVVALQMFFNWLRPYDPTDDAGNKVRSGMHYYVDHGTGCQYIKVSWFATLTPRVDRNGQHICE